MRITAINEAEAILEPFWDASLSGLKQWTIEPGAVHGLRVCRNRCWPAFEWARRPAKGPALRMTRRCEVECGDYDCLVLSVMAPPEAIVRLLAESDLGQRRRHSRKIAGVCYFFVGDSQPIHAGIGPMGCLGERQRRFELESVPAARLLATQHPRLAPTKR